MCSKAFRGKRSKPSLLHIDSHPAFTWSNSSPMTVYIFIDYVYDTYYTTYMKHTYMFTTDQGYFSHIINVLMFRKPRSATLC